MDGISISEEDQQLVEEISQKLRRDVNCLTEKDRSAKRRALEKLRKETVDKAECGAIASPVICTVCENLLLKPVLRMFSDPVERCRVLSVEFVDKYVGVASYSSLRLMLPYIVPSVVSRLGVQQLEETSEELRLSMVEMLVKLIQVADERSRHGSSTDGCNGLEHIERAHLLAAYMDDFCNILVRTLVDPFPDVKKVSCHCVRLLASSVARHFHMQAESFVKPLTVCLGHQHSKVRIEGLQALTSTILNGPVKCIENSLGPLGQKAFDPVPAVRMALFQCIAQLLREYVDRYSFHNRLLPLLVCGVTDEVDDIRQKSEQLYLQVGAQYLDENEQDLKDETDFGQRQYEGKSELQRSVGCCALVQRNLAKIVAPLLRDMQDWSASTRLKSVSVLELMLALAGEQCTQQLPAILAGLYPAGADEDAAVREKAFQCAEQLGRFLAIDTLCELVVAAVCTACGGKSKLSATVVVSASSAVSALTILARCLHAYNDDDRPRDAVQKQLKRIVAVLSRDEVCHSMDEGRQHSILLVVGQVLSLLSEENLSELSLPVFTLLVKMLSVATSDAVHKQVHCLISQQATLCQMASGSDLFAEHMAAILTALQDAIQSNSLVSSGVVSMDTLSPILQGAGSAIAQHLDIVVPLIRRSVDRTVDSSVKLDFFALLGELLQNADETFDAQQTFGHHVLTLIQEVYLPHLVWTPGRAPAALRATVMGSLLILLHCQCVSQQHIGHIAGDVLPAVLSGMDGDEAQGRVLSLRVLLRMLTVGSSSLDTEFLHRLYPDMLKRLDDSIDDIRLSCLRCWAAYFRSFPDEYDSMFYGAHVDTMYKGLLIHLDDASTEIQEAALGVLKLASRLDALKLLKMIIEVKARHRTTSYCDELEAHAQLSITESQEAS